MWTTKYLRRIDIRIVIITLLLMAVSLATLSSYSFEVCAELEEVPFFTPLVRSQLQWFLVGWVLFFFTAASDYNKLREYAHVLYVLMIVALVGLFFVPAIQNVHRWYKIPWLHANIQPSEGAKLALVIFMSWFLEKNAQSSRSVVTAFFALLITCVPFLLIYKQPDLGTALILLPVSCVMWYFGDLHPMLLRLCSWIGIAVLLCTTFIFSGVIPYEKVQPYARHVLKEYQFERLNPNTHHQKAAQLAIAIGGKTGVGWRNSEFTKGGSLPAACTDSIFPAFAEEFGFVGLFFVLILFYSLVYCSFQVTVVAKDPFGRLLAAGISVYIVVHVLVNIGMMIGFLPITGVPLVLLSYGGSSIMATMLALGILQSIYSRRFMF